MDTRKDRAPWLPPMADVIPTKEIEEAAKDRETEKKLAEEARKQDASGVQDDRHTIDMRTLGSRTLLNRMNPQAKALRELFAQEYLYDFDPVRAAQRCGYIGKSAISAARKLMSEPAVQRLIKERQKEFNTVVTLNQDDIIAAFWREGNRDDPGASHSARVAALGKLAQILGIVKPEGEVNVNIGGVMQVPTTSDSLDDWEKSAVNHQEHLKTDVHD